jgi:hypothetical protein
VNTKFFTCSHTSIGIGQTHRKCTNKKNPFHALLRTSSQKKKTYYIPINVMTFLDSPLSFSSRPLTPPHSCTFNFRFRSLRIAPGSAGSRAPLGGEFLAFQVSQMVSMVTHSTPSNLLMFSMCLFRKKEENPDVSSLSSFLTFPRR